jgi:hypothetical protein
LKKLEPTLFVKVKQSKSLFLLLVVLHVLSATSVFMIASLLIIKLALWFFIAVSSYFYWQRWQQDDYCFTLKYSSEFLWQLIYHNKKPESFKVFKSTVITSFLVVLHVKMTEGNRYFLIFFDSTEDESFRKLHVFLKIKS